METTKGNDMNKCHYVAIEAICHKCGEHFNPNDMDDTEHISRNDGSECGGEGEILGGYR
jgi:hypothetical protein